MLKGFTVLIILQYIQIAKYVQLKLMSITLNKNKSETNCTFLILKNEAVYKTDTTHCRQV